MRPPYRRGDSMSSPRSCVVPIRVHPRGDAGSRAALGAMLGADPVTAHPPSPCRVVEHNVQKVVAGSTDLAHSSVGPFGLLNVLARKVGVQPRRSRAETALGITEHLLADETRRLPVIDDCQKLPDASLEDGLRLPYGRLESLSDTPGRRYTAPLRSSRPSAQTFFEVFEHSRSVPALPTRRDA